MKRKILGNHCYNVSMVKFCWFLFLSWYFRFIRIIWIKTCLKEVKTEKWKCGTCRGQLYYFPYTALLTEQKSWGTGWPCHLIHWWQPLELLFLCFSSNFAGAWLYAWIWFNLCPTPVLKLKVSALVKVCSLCHHVFRRTTCAHGPSAIVFLSGWNRVLVLLSPWSYWHFSTKTYGISIKHVVHRELTCLLF